MRNAAGTLIWVLLLAAVSLGCGGAGSGGQASQEEGDLPAVAATTVNKIAFVNNGDLHTINPDGTGDTQLTGAMRASLGGFLAQQLESDEYYSWPTWSPDGTRLAASRVALSGTNAGVSLEVIDLETQRITTVFENEAPSLVADGAPHYIYWSPNARYLSFLAATDVGLTLYVWDSEAGGPATAIESNAPLYFHWRPDEQSIALHSGPDVKTAIPSGGGVGVTGDAFGFRVPAYSPDGSLLAYAANTGSGQALFLAPADDLTAARQLMETGPMAVFMWSPDGSELVVADQRNAGSPLFERLMLAPVDGGEATVLVEEEVLAFFWAPVGRRIAWVTVEPRHRQMVWWVSGLDGTEARRLIQLSPSGETFTVLSYFDQYAYSHSPWSPDGASLVVAGSGGGDASRRNGSSPGSDRVYVVDAVGGAQPRDIAAGRLAFWSWN